MSRAPSDHPIRVMLADDVDELRTLVRFALERSGRFTVVAEASNGAEAIDVAGRSQPDLLLLDISMPVMDGLEALPKVRDVSPRTTVVMLSGFSEERLGTLMSKAGAAGYVEKGISPLLLVDRLLDIMSSCR